jgi:hypothetical protein
MGLWDDRTILYHFQFEMRLKRKLNVEQRYYCEGSIMYALLKAIRAKLAGDKTLTDIVPVEDITSSYNIEHANYPCIILSIPGATTQEIAHIVKAGLNIDIYSNKNNEQLWVIYERIKFLLYNQVHSINNSSCVVHAIYEIRVCDNHYDFSGNAWHLAIQYEIQYSTTEFPAVTVSCGKVYADRTSVNAIPTMEIASFRGAVSLDITFESVVRTERERFGKDVYFHTGMARLTFEEMIFKASVIDLLWNIDSSPTSKLNDKISGATVYQVAQSSYPAYLQVLFQMTKTEDGKKLEIEAGKAVFQKLNIPFTTKDFSVLNCQWVLLGDNSGNVVKIAVET